MPSFDPEKFARLDPYLRDALVDLVERASNLNVVEVSLSAKNFYTPTAGFDATDILTITYLAKD